MILSSELLNKIFVLLLRDVTRNVSNFSRDLLLLTKHHWHFWWVESWYLALAADKWLVMTDARFTTITVTWLWISTTILAALCITDRNGTELFVNSETSDRSFAAVGSKFISLFENFVQLFSLILHNIHFTIDSIWEKNCKNYKLWNVN